MHKLILTTVFLALGSATALAAPATQQTQNERPATTQQQNEFVGIVQTDSAQGGSASSAQECAVGPVWMHTGRMKWRAGQHSW